MRILENMTVRSRLMLSGVVIVIFFIIFGGVSIGQMQRLGELTAILYNHPLKVSNAALDARAGVINIHCDMKDIYDAKTTPAIALAIQKIQSEERRVYEALELINRRILGNEGKELVAETIDMFSNWKPIRVEVEEMVINKGMASADMVIREKAATYADRLEHKMSQLADYARNKADGFMADAEQVKARIVNNVIFFVIGLIAIFLLTGFMVSSNIMSSLEVLKQTLAGITQTGELAKVSLSGKNEITEIAEHFNRVVDRMQNVFWVADGENMLNRELFQGLSTEAIMETGLTKTARYVDACAGAIYQYRQDEKKLELCASYALMERSHLGNSFSLGQGIVGQVAREKKAILLSHIKREEAQAQSGTFSEPPLVIFAVPLMFEQDLFYGVMEIASFKKLGEPEQDFIESSADIVATLMHTSQQNQRIKGLLEEAEKSNKVLLEQADELTAMNKEARQQAGELHEQNLALEIQRREIEEANRLKSEFLSNMSHELRTPLNSVNALSRVLIQQAQDRITHEEMNYLTIIERNGKHLLSLINNILDLSKIESGQVELDITRFSLAQLINNLVENLIPLSDEKGLSLTFETEQGLPEMSSDKSRVFQILQNIVANAIKFTEKGSVRIQAEEERQMFVIRVTDTGVGIPAKDIETIFNEFRQADGASTRKFEGTGLGLSIAYKAAKILGGDIQVDSTEGQGSEFTVFLPKECPGDVQAAASRSKRTLSRKPEPSAKPAEKPSTERKPANQKTILIVDDDPKILAFMASTFQAEGYGTLVTTSGQEALELAAKYQPFAITLDVIMPGMDGWEVLTRLKKETITAHIPVIIVSVSQDRETGIALGAVGYISKPVDSGLLMTEMRRVLGELPFSVMVVDDNALDRDNVVRILGKEGIKATTAEDGEACLSRLKTTRPDLLVLDLVMPEMDGFKLLEKIRSTPEYETLPVIVVTAKDLTREEKKQLEKQASSVLLKSPLTPDQLMEKIKKIFEELPEPLPDDVSGPPADESGQRTDPILLVEDNDATIIQIQKILEELDITVSLAKDGKEALAYLEKHRPQGIILDLMMPHVDGFQVLEALKQNPEIRHIPVLVLSAKELTAEEHNRLQSNNIHQFIQKGDVDKSELMGMVQQMLGIYQPVPVSQPSAVPPKTESQKKEAPQKTPASRDMNPCLLVVEDNPDNLITVKAVLGKDYEIQSAADGETGLKKARQMIPTLILLDMSLPKMDGMEVLEALKADPATEQIPVIALTAQAMKGDRQRMIEAGCSDYISKPIEPDLVKKTIAKWFHQENR